MALCVSGEHFILNLQFRPKTTLIVRASSLLDHSDHCLRPSVKCSKKKNYNLLFCCCCCCCGNNPSSNPTPSSSSSSAPRKSKNIKTLLGFSSAAVTACIIYNISNNSGGNDGGWKRGGGGGGGGAGSGGNKGYGGSGFWSRIFSLSAAIDKELEEEEEDELAEKDTSDHDDLSCSSPAGKNQEWVVFHHGLIPAININLVFDQVFKKLMISTGILIKVTKNIQLFDHQYPWQRSNDINDSNCSLLGVIEMLMPSVKSGHEIYRQGQVRHQLSEALWNSGGILIWFPDYKKPIWQSPESFRCISIGSLPQWGPFIHPDYYSNDHREKLEYYESIVRAYKMRMDKARPCLIPLAVQNEIFIKLKEAGKEVISPSTRSHLFKIMEDRLIKWYHDRSYSCAYVVFLEGSICNAKEIVCEVFEGVITRLDIQFIDKLNNVCEEGNTQLALIKRQLPKVLQQGHVYNREAAKKALRNLDLLDLFSSIQITPRVDKKYVDEIVLEIKLKEYEANQSEVMTSWDIVPGHEGRPTMASLQPSGTVTYIHKNLGGLNRSIIGSVSSPNLLNPQAGDLQFQLQYVHPYVDGVNDPRDRTLHINFYPRSNPKMSPVFPGVPGSFPCSIPPIWVDRAGIKTYITENFRNHQNKFIYGLVMEMIRTSYIEDLNGCHCITNGSWDILDVHGNYLDYFYGPPTTHSGTGVDYMVFAQANIIGDNTKFVNGMTVGQRTMFQLDQGLGIGSKFPFFNRHQLTHTRFLQLNKLQVEEGAGKPPPSVLVLHGHYGGCVGDLPGYDAFTLGGPKSVRGYSKGELGACRYMLEVAAELRIPVKNTYVYAFAEHGNDLGSSKDVRGNPTQYYHRKGQGSSYGLGVSLITPMGQVRAEYAIDHNEGTGAVFVQFGERF